MNAPAPVTPATDQLMTLPLHAIAPDPLQDRKHFDEDALRELADNIAAVGVVQPIVVRPPFPGEWERIPPPGQLQAQYILIAGERRWRASGLAGKTEIVAIIKSGLTPDDVLILQAVENLQRKDLTLREQATLCARLVNECGDLDGACARISKSKSWVSLRAGIVEMPAEIRAVVDSGAVRDVQIANSLSQLHKLEPQRCAEIVKQFAEPDEDSDPPSRSDVAYEVQWARARKQREAEQAQREAEKAANPSADDDGDEDDDGSDYRARQTARSEHLEKLRPKLGGFAEAATDALSEALGYQRPAGMKETEWHHTAPARIQPPYLSQWADTELPQDTEDAEFTAVFAMPAAGYQQLEPHFAAGSISLQIHLGPLTPAEALAVEQALGRPLEWGLRSEISGMHVSDLIRALTAKPVAEQDPLHIEPWLSSVLREKPGARVQARHVYDRYAAACKAAALEPIAFTHNDWGTAVAAAGIQKIRSNGVQYLNVELIG